MDLDLRKIASTALLVIAVWMAFAAAYFRHTGASAVNAFLVAAGLAACALFGRSRTRATTVAFSIAVALSVWLFFATWTLAGATPRFIINNVFFSVLAFGFACAPLATPAHSRHAFT